MPNIVRKLESKLKTINLIFKILLCMFLVSCAGPKDGVAPSESTPPAVVSPDPNGSWEFEMNFSEKISTSNSWDVVLDTSDVTGYVSLANGWKVEVSND